MLPRVGGAADSSFDYPNDWLGRRPELQADWRAVPTGHSASSRASASGGPTCRFSFSCDRTAGAFAALLRAATEVVTNLLNEVETRSVATTPFNLRTESGDQPQWN